MDDATRSEVDAWLAIAQRDLDSAKRLLTGDPPYRDTAAYHCHQSAEKALKAFLTAAAILFPKTHDLTALVKLATGADIDAANWRLMPPCTAIPTRSRNPTMPICARRCCSPRTFWQA